MASLAGKVITLTGGASGIGAATAKLLASRGAILALSDINHDGLQKVADSIRAQGHKHFTTAAVDIRDRNQVRDWIRATTDKFGPLDGAANVAGVIGKHQNVHSIWELSTEEYQFVNDVNAMGLFHCLAEQLAHGVMKNGTSIASVASLCGLKGTPKSAAYCGSKHAAVGLIRAAAVEAGPREIRVNGIAPGIVETPMLSASLETDGAKMATTASPIPRNAQPVEIGYILAFLLSDESKFTTGSIYSADGGLTA